MRASVVSNGESSDPFSVTNGTKQGCVMAPVLFALFFSVMLKYAFTDVDNGVELKFRTSGGLFNQQRFKAKTLLRQAIIRDLLFADDAALCATSREGAQLLGTSFSAACKAFWSDNQHQENRGDSSTSPHSKTSSWCKTTATSAQLSGISDQSGW